MSRSKYDQLSNPEGKVWDRLRFSETEWAALTTEQRETHYNRHKPCDHAYEYLGIEVDKGVFVKSDERLREQYSLDPYFHTAHMTPCQRWGIKPPERNRIECHCQMCLGKFGVMRGEP